MKRVLLSGVALIASCGCVLGQTYNVETIIVSATRVSTKLAETPAPVSAVTAADFESRQVLDFKDVLERLPNVDFFGGPRPSGEMPSIRAATGRQLLILVDGVRQSAAPGLATPLYLEPRFLSQVEVLRGAASVLYGPGALGGVFSFQTLMPSDLLASGQSVGGDASVDYHSAAASYRGVARAYGQSGDFAGMGGVSYREWGAIRQGGGGKLRPSDGHATDALARGSWRITDRFEVAASHQYYDTDDFRPNNPQADNTFPYMQNNFARQNQSVVNLYGTNSAGERDLTGAIYRTNLTTGADPNTTVTPALTGNVSKLETIGGSVVKAFEFQTGTVENRLAIGTDTYRDRISSLSNGQPDGVQPSGKQSAVGVFARNEIVFAPWFSITPAARWDRFKTSVATGVAPGTSSESTSPQVTAKLRPISEVIVYASYGEAYRAPAVNEMFQSLTGNTFFANFVPNTNLRPEQSSEWSAGAALNRPLPWDDARLSLRLDVFDQKIDDLIVSRVIGTYRHPVLGVRPIQQYQNVSRAKRHGFEFAASAEVSALRLGISYGQVRSQDRDTGENLFSPPDKWSLDFGYSFTPEFTVRWQSAFVDAQGYDSTLVRRRPSYDVHDIFASWSPTDRHWRLSLGLTNVFDERYAAYKQSTLYPTTYEQGRGLRLGVTTKL